MQTRRTTRSATSSVNNPQGRQTLRAQHHRHRPHAPPRPTQNQRRSRAGRHLRHPHNLATETLDAPNVITAYKNLSHVERDFRIIKTDDLDLRPIFHYLADRVRAHVFLFMLAAYITWHLRKALTPLTFTDEHTPDRDDPAAPARRSTH